MPDCLQGNATWSSDASRTSSRPQPWADFFFLYEVILHIFYVILRYTPTLVPYREAYLHGCWRNIPQHAHSKIYTYLNTNGHLDC